MTVSASVLSSSADFTARSLTGKPHTVHPNPSSFRCFFLWVSFDMSPSRAPAPRLTRCCCCCCFFPNPRYPPPQWGAADAEIKVPSGENTELKRSPFKAWSRSVYSHTCHAYCQEFLPYLFLPIRSIHLHFFPKTSPDFFMCWLWLILVPV